MKPGEPAARRGMLVLWGAVVAGLLAALAIMQAGGGAWADSMLRRSPSLLYDEALRLISARQYTAALERLKTALALAPARAECHFLASTCYLELGDLPTSDAEADLAICHCPPGDPDTWRYYDRRGSLENKLSHREQAIRDWAIAAHYNPGSAPAHAQLAQAYAAREDYPEARRFMAEALRLDPSNPEYAFLLGTYYMAGNDWTAALPLLETAVRLDATMSLAYRHLGYCAMQTARYGDAQEYFEKYRQECPDDPLARLWLRRVRQRLVR